VVCGEKVLSRMRQLGRSRLKAVRGGELKGESLNSRNLEVNHDPVYRRVKHVASWSGSERGKPF